MFLTSDILKEYEACQQGIVWFERVFPQGAELVDVIHAKHVPYSFLHWGRLHLNSNDEERRAYEEVCEIKESTSVFECDHIESSTMVSGSSCVYNSAYIYGCNAIINCTDITDSTKITDSHHIINSTSTLYSDYCIGSNNVKKSQYILDSSFIINSHDIYKGSLIESSSFVFNGKNLTNCGFVRDSGDLTNCLFCCGYNKKSYSIFNHEINTPQWEYLFEEYQSQIEPFHLEMFEEWDQENPEHGVTIHHSYLEMFEGFGDKLNDFVYWVKHLPYYDSTLAYQITFLPQFLSK